MFVEIEVWHDGDYRKGFVRSTRIVSVVEDREDKSTIILSGIIDKNSLYELQTENSVYEIMRQLDDEEES